MSDNSSISSSPALHCPYTPESRNPFLFLVMIVEVVVGLPGNLLALWIFCFRMKFWKPHAIFLFNLMLADFLLLACVPFRIDANLRGDDWVFGEVFCRVDLFMLSINRSASIGFMTVVALNRYFKVLHPLHSVSLMSVRHAVCLCVFVWAIVVAFRIPLLTTDLLHQRENRSICQSFGSYENPPMAITVHYIAAATEVILPWFLLLFCSGRIIYYLRKREEVVPRRKFKNAIRSVAVINVVFTFCFLPAIVLGLGGLVIKRFEPENCEGYRKIVRAFMQSVSLTYLNSALDPLIYNFSSSMFRESLKNVFKKLRR